jgi:hypothetical protein
MSTHQQRRKLTRQEENGQKKTILLTGGAVTLTGDQCSDGRIEVPPGLMANADEVIE